MAGKLRSFCGKKVIPLRRYAYCQGKSNKSKVSAILKKKDVCFCCKRMAMSKLIYLGDNNFIVKKISSSVSLMYDETNDTYTCHVGKLLNALYVKKQKQKNKSGYESDVTVCECKSCTDCSCKEKCTHDRENKRLYVSKSFLEKRQESYENIVSETGILYRMNWSIQEEGRLVF